MAVKSGANEIRVPEVVPPEVVPEVVLPEVSVCCLFLVNQGA